MKGTFEPLADPLGAVIDIVFVHGLRGDPVKSWSTDECFWPKELLPTTIPNARIFSWGYDAKILHFWHKRSPNLTIHDHGTKLLTDLAAARTQTPDRPIIFIAHSLGGIVCAKAAQLAQSCSGGERNIWTHTRGYIFLGTPLRGLDGKGWGELMVRLGQHLSIETVDILDELTKRSKTLMELIEFFPKAVFARAGEIDGACFWENDKVRLPHIGGQRVRIVESDSACFDGWSKAPLNGNHTTMCKFDGDEQAGYVAITNRLKVMIGNLDKELGRNTERNVHMGGSTFGHNNGVQIGNAYSEGLSPAVTGNHTFNHNYERPT